MGARLSRLALHAMCPQLGDVRIGPGEGAGMIGPTAAEMFSPASQPCHVEPHRKSRQQAKTSHATRISRGKTPLVQDV